MSQQIRLEVSIPFKVATNQLMEGQLRTSVRRLLKLFDGINVSNFRKEGLGYYIDAYFPDRNKALYAVRAIRRLSLENAGDSAENFTYTIDNDELLIFDNEDDKYSFRSKSYVEELHSWYEASLNETP